MKVYLIHDYSRVDRQLLYEKELEVQGITAVETIPAVKMYQHIPKNISEAHKECIRRAIKDDHEMVVVLEDDVRFACPGAYNEFLRLSKELPAGWDMMISGSYDYRLGTPGSIGKGPLVKVSIFSGLHCYMIHKRFYVKFINTRGVNNLDKAIRGNVFMTWPQLALQWTTRSDNTGKTLDFNSIFSNKIKLWKKEDL